MSNTEQHPRNEPPSAPDNSTYGDRQVLAFWLICFCLIWVLGLLHLIVPR
jgi:hypothetical protein